MHAYFLLSVSLTHSAAELIAVLYDSDTTISLIKKRLFDEDTLQHCSAAREQPRSSPTGRASWITDDAGH